MSSRRKNLDTGLFRPREEIEQEETQAPTSGDMSPRLTRVSFDIREDQIHDLRELKVKLGRQGKKARMSDLAQEALDLLLAKYG